MTIKTSGQLKFTDIEAEFKQGTNPIKLSEYYRGGPEVPDGPTANANIAKSGQQKLSNYYGAMDGPPPPYDPDHDDIHDVVAGDPNAFYYIAGLDPMDTTLGYTPFYTVRTTHSDGWAQPKRYAQQPDYPWGRPTTTFPTRGPTNLIKVIKDHSGNNHHLTPNRSDPNTFYAEGPSDAILAGTAPFGRNTTFSFPKGDAADTAFQNMWADEQRVYTRTDAGANWDYHFKAMTGGAMSSRYTHFCMTEQTKQTGYFSRGDNNCDNGEPFTAPLGTLNLNNRTVTGSRNHLYSQWVPGKQTDGVTAVACVSINWSQLAATNEIKPPGFFVFKIIDDTRIIASQMLMSPNFGLRLRGARGYDADVGFGPKDNRWHSYVIGVVTVPYFSGSRVDWNYTWTNGATAINVTQQAYAFSDRALGPLTAGTRFKFPTATKTNHTDSAAGGGAVLADGVTNVGGRITDQSQMYFRGPVTGGQFPNTRIAMGVLPSAVKVHAMAGFTKFLDQATFNKLAAAMRSSVNL